MRIDFKSRYGPWAVVAGGSSGIGLAIATQIAAQGIDLVLLDRDGVALEQAADHIRAAHDVDVRVSVVELAGVSALPEVQEVVEGTEVGLFVADTMRPSGGDLFIRRSLEQTLQMVTMNCQTVVALSHYLGRKMASRHRGGLILTAPQDASAGSAYMAAENATKAFSLVLAEGLWIELGQFDVDVLTVPAAPIDRAETKAAAPSEMATAALDALGNTGPWTMTSTDGQTAEQAWATDRVALMERLTKAAAVLSDLPPLRMPSRT